MAHTVKVVKPEIMNLVMGFPGDGVEYFGKRLAQYLKSNVYKGDDLGFRPSPAAPQIWNYSYDSVLSKVLQLAEDGKQRIFTITGYPNAVLLASLGCHIWCIHPDEDTFVTFHNKWRKEHDLPKSSDAEISFILENRYQFWLIVNDFLRMISDVSGEALKVHVINPSESEL